MRGVILYGPPAAGKDTVTRALCALDERYDLFLRLKAGPGRTAGYRLATEHQLDKLRRQGDIIWENRRYGAVYVVDRPTLASYLGKGIPILHLGQIEAVKAVTYAASNARWLVTYLWCPRDIAAARIAERGTGDASARLTAWDETKPLLDAGLQINTAQVSPEDAAQAIHGRLAGE